MDKIYQRVSAIYNWESLKKAYSGTASGTTLALATRFSHFVENDNYSSDNEYAEGPVVFIGTDYTPYKIVSFSDRRRYRDQSGIVYLDLPNSNLVFTVDPGSKAVEYDYIETPAELTTTTDTFWIPDRFTPIIYHGMCVDDFVIQQSEKARSYRDENLNTYNMYLNDMKSWNFKLIQM